MYIDSLLHKKSFVLYVLPLWATNNLRHISQSVNPWPFLPIQQFDLLLSFCFIKTCVHWEWVGVDVSIAQEHQFFAQSRSAQPLITLTFTHAVYSCVSNIYRLS